MRNILLDDNEPLFDATGDICNQDQLVTAAQRMPFTTAW
jgi:hypothetical protein